MNTIYDINVIDDILLENITNNSEFREFSNIMTELSFITDNHFYLEAAKDTTINMRKKLFGDMNKNTIEVTRDIVGAYDNITTANANLIKSGWDLIMRSVNLMTRALGFVINKISTIPKFILKTADRVADIPGEVKAKIKGNIALYITAQDIGAIYNQLLIRRLIDYIALITKLTRGDYWATMLNRRLEDKDDVNISIKPTKLKIGTSDMDLFNKMDDEFEHLKNTEFKPTIIQMKDESTINIYFGNDKSITFTDHHGDKQECSYYEALTMLIKDLEKSKEDLKNVQKEVSNKMKRTEANQNYAGLSNWQKVRINTNISQISKVSTIIGNVIKYIMTDLDTINKSVDKIIGSTHSSKTNISKAANTPETKFNAKV